MINATNKSQPKELIPAGNYIARCYQMIHIGTIQDTYLGQPKIFNKVRIGWELPTELKVFNADKGEQPCVISKEYTLSMHEKATLRKLLASWRSKDFTEKEAESFDITKLLGKCCFLNIIHKPSKDGLKIYEEIAGVTPLPKGMICPPQITNSVLWDYDNPDYSVFNLLPDFIKQKIQSSEEYKKLHSPNDFNMDQVNYEHNVIDGPANDFVTDDLPF